MSISKWCRKKYTKSQLEPERARESQREPEGARDSQKEPVAYKILPRLTRPMRCSQCCCYTLSRSWHNGPESRVLLPKELHLQHTINKSTPSCDQRIPISCPCQAVAKPLTDCEPSFFPIYLRLAQIWSSGVEEKGRSGLLTRASWYIHCFVPFANSELYDQPWRTATKAQYFEF